MVVVKLKPANEILKHLANFNKVSIFGCDLGAGRCMQGGLQEAKNLSKDLLSKGINIVEVKSIPGMCIAEKTQNVKVSFSKTDVVLSLACGAGTQVLAESIDVPVITGVNTLFIGADFNRKLFREYCIACGDCIISLTGGLCPVARCPKSLRNGPCGGAINGMCEVDKNIPCIWFKIAEKLNPPKYLEQLMKCNFTDYRKLNHPRMFSNEF